MISLTVEEIVSLQEKLIDKCGGIRGVRDIGMVESAVYSAMQSFGGQEVYGTPEKRAARLAYALTMNHGFLDGNKRIGMLVMLMTLRLNHVELKYSQQELVALGLGIAAGELDYEAILYWIRGHIKRS